MQADYARVDARIVSRPAWQAELTIVTSHDGYDSVDYWTCEHSHCTAGAAERCAKRHAATIAKRTICR